MNPAIADIFDLLRSKGQARYDGEQVTQLEHALQSAQWAERSGADSALIAAALLHDLGHLLHEHAGTPTRQHAGTSTRQKLDDLHQYRCLPFLRPLFGPATLEPIRLHVDAKRFLCAREPGYLDSLSPDSRRSLTLQGGVFDAGQATAFEALPYAGDAVRLRRWDDLAKSASAQPPGLEHFLHHLEISTADHAS